MSKQALTDLLDYLWDKYHKVSVQDKASIENHIAIVRRELAVINLIQNV